MISTVYHYIRYITITDTRLYRHVTQQMRTRNVRMMFASSQRACASTKRSLWTGGKEKKNFQLKSKLCVVLWAFPTSQSCCFLLCCSIVSTQPVLFNFRYHYIRQYCTVIWMFWFLCAITIRYIAISDNIGYNDNLSGNYTFLFWFFYLLSL